MEIMYGNRVWKSCAEILHGRLCIEWKPFMEILYSSVLWKSCMEVMYGNLVWKLCMEILYGCHVWKLCMETSGQKNMYGNLVWKSCMELVFDFFEGRETDFQEVGGTGWRIDGRTGGSIVL